MPKIVVLVGMHKTIINLSISGELDLLMKSTVKTPRSNYPTSVLIGSSFSQVNHEHTNNDV